MNTTTYEPLMKHYEEFENSVRAYNPAADVVKLRAAFEFAASRHADQLRKDGSPYVTHPLATSAIVADMGLDDESLIAALLHDCIEDTSATHAEIEKLFGADVAGIVDGVTKLTRVHYTSKEEEQMENLRKMFMAMARDIRVILIKIADRLHNMRTMEYQSPIKQLEKSLETLEVYAPIAHRLGMQKIKWELEDLSMRYLEPEAYDEISRGVAAREVENKGFFKKTEERIRTHLINGDCICGVYGRVKHVYSIYRKMQEQEKSFHEVLDLYAFRVVVKSIAECFHALGHIHEIFTPIPGKFKDYITTPKPNGYQSLHTTVLGGEGLPFEVQIRTEEMHEVAEYGVAAHWKYKHNVKSTNDEEKFAWVRRLLESQQDADPDEFYQALRTDMFADEVFVLTPLGDVKCLPAGATPIDFAYAVHSEVGNRMTGAIVNGRIVPYSHILQNGDIVEVLTSNSAKGPSRDWLNNIKSPEARNKIRQWFKKEKRDENIVHGKVSFESELRRAGFTINDVEADDVLPKVLKKLAYPALNDLLAAIGYGGISAHKCVNRIRDDLQLSLKARRKEEPESVPGVKTVAKPHKTKTAGGVVVEGLGSCLLKFAQCCSPVPGDPIIGFITRGYGVSIHRGDCPNYLKSRGDQDESNRWVNVSWDNSETDVYATSLTMISNRRDNVVLDVVGVISAMKLHMITISGRDVEAGTAVALTVEVHNNSELETLMSRLRGINGANVIKRAEAF